jgi:hypothetical protein
VGDTLRFAEDAEQQRVVESEGTAAAERGERWWEERGGGPSGHVESGGGGADDRGSTRDRVRVRAVAWGERLGGNGHSCTVTWKATVDGELGREAEGVRREARGAQRRRRGATKQGGRVEARGRMEAVQRGKGPARVSQRGQEDVDGTRCRRGGQQERWDTDTVGIERRTARLSQSSLVLVRESVR